MEFHIHHRPERKPSSHLYAPGISVSGLKTSVVPRGAKKWEKIFYERRFFYVLTGGVLYFTILCSVIMTKWVFFSDKNSHYCEARSSVRVLFITEGEIRAPQV